MSSFFVLWSLVFLPPSSALPAPSLRLLISAISTPPTCPSPSPPHIPSPSSHLSCFPFPSPCHHSSSSFHVDSPTLFSPPFLPLLPLPPPPSPISSSFFPPLSPAPVVAPFSAPRCAALLVFSPLPLDSLPCSSSSPVFTSVSSSLLFSSSSSSSSSSSLTASSSFLLPSSSSSSLSTSSFPLTLFSSSSSSSLSLAPPSSSSSLSSTSAVPSSNFDPQLPFAVVAFIPGLTERLRRCCRGVVNVVTKPLTLLTMFLKKAKSQLASPGGEIYVRHCTTCRMAYFGETGRTAVDRNRQHDHAIASGAVKSSALAWHAVKYKHYDFEDPLVLRRVAFLRKRRFLESLFGHLCPPSLSINADCDRALSGDGRAPGLLWKIDPGWVIVGLNHHLLDVALERASLPRGPRKRLCLFPPPPVPFISQKSNVGFLFVRPSPLAPRCGWSSTIRFTRPPSLLWFLLACAIPTVLPKRMFLPGPLSLSLP